MRSFKWDMRAGRDGSKPYPKGWWRSPVDRIHRTFLERTTWGMAL